MIMMMTIIIMIIITIIIDTNFRQISFNFSQYI